MGTFSAIQNVTVFLVCSAEEDVEGAFMQDEHAFVYYKRGITMTDRPSGRAGEPSHVVIATSQ